MNLVVYIVTHLSHTQNTSTTLSPTQPPINPPYKTACAIKRGDIIDMKQEEIESNGTVIIGKTTTTTTN